MKLFDYSRYRTARLYDAIALTLFVTLITILGCTILDLVAAR